METSKPFMLKTMITLNCIKTAIYKKTERSNRKQLGYLKKVTNAYTNFNNF